MHSSSKVFLKHPTECKFFSLYGDQIIGSYAMTFDNILRLYANAVNKDNQIAQDFIRTQLVPAPMSLDEAIRSLYDDYGYQTDRSMLRLTIYDAKNGDPLWTGLRSTQYVDKELKLDQEQISKYVQSFLSELVG